MPSYICPHHILIRLAVGIHNYFCNCSCNQHVEAVYANEDTESLNEVKDPDLPFTSHLMHVLANSTIAPQWSGICFGISGIPRGTRNDNGQCVKERMRLRRQDTNILSSSCQSRKWTNQWNRHALALSPSLPPAQREKLSMLGPWIPHRNFTKCCMIYHLGQESSVYYIF